MYKIIDDTQIKRLADGAVIPADPRNVDYREYLDWLAGGNSPDPADQPTPPVYSCSPWQFRKALSAIGIRKAVEDAVSSSSDQEMKDGWQFATEFRSDDPFVQSMAAAFGKSQTELEQLILMATTL